VKLDDIYQDYVEAVFALPAMQDWITAAKRETEILYQYEF